MNAVKIYEDAKWKLEHNEITLGEFEKMIKPLEDVVKAKHGEWIGYNSDFYCSNCNRFHTVRSNFCPNCGAHMGERKEAE